MREVHLQLTDLLYAEAQRRAFESGFASLDEYIVDIVSGELGQETENLDHRFTPKVVSHLKQIQEEISAGATTYTESEIDEHFKERARAWRESRAN